MPAMDVSWGDCTIITQTFATVDDHELKADIIFPPDLRPGIHPLIVTYHGGYLISGSRNHYPFMPGWLPGYAASESAVIVSPDYRLLPSATATEVRADLESFWSWLLETLPLVLTLHSPDHQIDLDRILLQGSSAGGFCVAHLALDHPDQIRAAIMVYPMLDCLSEYMANGPPNAVELAKEKGLWTGDELDEQVKKAKSAGWISERTDPQDFQLTRSMMKGGEFGKGFGSKENNPIDRIRQGVGIGFPSKVWILHGKEDTGVPVQGSTDFVEQVEEAAWKTDIKLDVIDSEPSEHGFDRSWTMKDQKLTDRLDWISQSWL